MAPSTVHLPNGHVLTVQPSFGGLIFKAGDLNLHHHAFPPGWMIVINSEDGNDSNATSPQHSAFQDGAITPTRQRRIHQFRKPTLCDDHLYISSISNPPSTDFRPATSPTRQIAMMLWATLWWYFHQPDPSSHASTKQAAEETALKGEWRVHINKEGIFRGKHLLPKLERMGLIASEDSTVGLDPNDGVSETGEGWRNMFVSRRSFWQLDPRIYLFTLAPTRSASPYPTVSPSSSRPTSPTRSSNSRPGTPLGYASDAVISLGPQGRSVTPPGPYTSNSHLPTFYPPPPPQYTTTNGTRHPIRPKPPRQGETFYTRYVPSLGQYISFRVALLDERPCAHRGPVSYAGVDGVLSSAMETLHVPGNVTPSEPASPAWPAREPAAADTAGMSDVQLLHRWMNDARVAKSWGEQGPQSHQEAFLKHGLTAKHSFPVIGCFDGRPFGYFEIYWVKEDRLNALLQAPAGDWDRGLHVLVGEQEFRGAHRVRVWLSALLHYCWLADARTGVVMMEPNVENEKIRTYCEEVGFYKDGEVTFPHKRSNLMKVSREYWEAPAL